MTKPNSFEGQSGDPKVRSDLINTDVVQGGLIPNDKLLSSQDQLWKEYADSILSTRKYLTDDDKQQLKEMSHDEAMKILGLIDKREELISLRNDLTDSQIKELREININFALAYLNLLDFRDSYLEKKKGLTYKEKQKIKSLGFKELHNYLQKNPL
ncbi:MAG: hypothetical protein N4A38_04215 [Candidatus Gracilibacteria bacterium]|nr:hypothetical protein [Candidatus Gracilibacteria bacterium]